MSKKSHKGSLFYQLTNAAGLNINANREGGIATSFKTQKNYKKSLHYAADYFKSNGIRNSNQIDAAAIQSYSDFLCGNGYAPSTVHTYLAPVCKAVGVSMDKITKPVRYVSEFTKCRTSDSEAAEKDNPTILLNSYLGLRRCELTRLHGNDLQQDRLGNWYVYVDKGKGGKAQRQYILPTDVEKVRPFFDGSSNLLFRKADMDPKYAYHSQRHATYIKAVDCAFSEHDLVATTKCRDLRLTRHLQDEPIADLQILGSLLRIHNFRFNNNRTRNNLTVHHKSSFCSKYYFVVAALLSFNGSIFPKAC